MLTGGVVCVIVYTLTKYKPITRKEHSYEKQVWLSTLFSYRKNVETMYTRIETNASWLALVQKVQECIQYERL